MISSARLCSASKYCKSYPSEYFALRFVKVSRDASGNGNVIDRATARSMLSVSKDEFENESVESAARNTNVDHSDDANCAGRQLTEHEKEIARLHEEACEFLLDTYASCPVSGRLAIFWS
ncbi:hypothetical protein GJAV_G00082030 [Gymnothorax javanicus]|nr:hypothetical protein GJAV_G00082030 [Gymnothorax javanicus]